MAVGCRRHCLSATRRRCMRLRSVACSYTSWGGSCARGRSYTPCQPRHVPWKTATRVGALPKSPKACWRWSTPLPLPQNFYCSLSQATPGVSSSHFLTIVASITDAMRGVQGAVFNTIYLKYTSRPQDPEEHVSALHVYAVFMAFEAHLSLGRT